MNKNITTNNIILNRLDIISNYTCNFHCANCSTYCYQQETKFVYNVEEFVPSLKYLQTYASIKNLNIYGGEPTIHPGMETFLQTIKNNISSETKLEMITNGWWMPDEDRFGNLFKIIDRVGQGIHPQLLNRLSLDDIRACMERVRKKYHIETKLYIDPSFALYGYTDIPLHKELPRCRFDKCTILLPNNKLSRCGILTSVTKSIASENFIKTRENSYFNIFDGNTINFQKWLDQAPECCQYCTGDMFFVPHFDYNTKYFQELRLP